MTISYFGDKSIEPDEKSLFEAIQETGPLWSEIKSHIYNNYENIHELLKFPYKKAGWSLRIIQKKRVVFYFVPLDGEFRIAFALGDRAVAAAEQSTLSDSLLESLKNSKRYMEGTGIHLNVNSRDDAEDVKKLIRIKVEN